MLFEAPVDCSMCEPIHGFVGVNQYETGFKGRLSSVGFELLGDSAPHKVWVVISLLTVDCK